MPAWDADIDLDIEIAADLIGSRFAVLTPIGIRELGVGWDNHAYLVNDRYVFRIPHRRLAAELIRSEVAALRYLDGRLPLPIPRVEFYAEPDDRFPYPFMGYPFFLGEIASEQEWTDDLRYQAAAPLGRFLRALHSLPTTGVGVPDMPGDDLRRADMTFRLPIVRQKIEKLGPAFPDGERILSRMAELAGASPHLGRPVWVHGDLYPRHMLVGSTQEICGVIDWGDVHWGDPALDLAIAFMFLPPLSWNTFRDAYGGIDDATWDRARFRAITHSVYLFEYGQQTASATVLRDAQYTLANAMRTNP